MILACTGTEDSGPRNRLSNLQSRADPNQRLVRAFGINNAFTTTDDAHRKHFRKTAEACIRFGDDKWKDLAKLAETLVFNSKTKALSKSAEEILSNRLDWVMNNKKKWIHSNSEKGNRIPSNDAEGIVRTVFLRTVFPQTSKINGHIVLMPFVQSLCLKMSLYVLFGLDPLSLREEDIEVVAKSINRIWMRSKQERNDELGFVHETELRQALANILPDHELTPKENPLNYILPAYETLWRVVHRCLLQVSFRNEALALEWRQILERFLKDPTEARFEEIRPGVGGISAHFVIAEASRLFPPTRRVYRKFQFTSQKYPEDVAADIESCHRDLSVWGQDSLNFNPSRWNNLSDEARNAFMPFGGTPFICPAKKNFGPRMIGVLVAALAVDLSDFWKLKALSIEDEIQTDEVLDLARHAYESLILVQKFDHGEQNDKGSE
ncbi:hypothetical protein MMC12_005417 [Toensbergia leucococca]|nr:hypothetical protein [Toensbergia leucococca]